MSALTDEDRKNLLVLARSVIESKLIGGAKIKRPDVISPPLREKRGCFVTLHKNGTLRGCIGTIEPVSSLIDNVAENAINAAIHDTRFPMPVSFEELGSITIEISVLTVPKKLELENRQELSTHLVAGRDGLILRHGWRQSTYLPQVWEHFPDKEDFLDSLCQKGGMPVGCWRDAATEIFTYQAEVFHEEQDKFIEIIE